MAGFVDDETDLDYPKTAQRPTRSGAEDHTLRAEDWNRLCQAAVDLRTAVLALRTTTADLPLDPFTALVDGLVPAPGVATGTKSLHDDGTWKASSGGSSSLSITADTNGLPVNPNISTLGTVDWAAYNISNSAGLFDNTAATSKHYKSTDGRLFSGFRWIASGASSPTIATVGGQPGRSTTVTDSVASTALSNDPNYSYIQPTGGTGWGNIIKIPVDANESHTLNLYLRTTDVNVEWTTWFSWDVAGVQTTTTTSPGFGSNRDVLITVTYTAGQAGFLNLRSRVTSIASGATARRMMFGYATLS